jgi:hypothetical protein
LLSQRPQLRNLKCKFEGPTGYCFDILPYLDQWSPLAR